MDGTWKCGHGMGIWRWMAGLKISGIFLHWTHHLSYLRAVWGGCLLLTCVTETEKCILVSEDFFVFLAIGKSRRRWPTTFVTRGRAVSQCVKRSVHI